MLPVAEADADSTSTWLAWREAVSLVVLRLEYTEEYARVWITREAAGDRIKARGKTIEGWDVSILPAACGVIDWDAGALRFPEQVIDNVELCLDGLVTAARLPAPKGNAAGWEGWSAGRFSLAGQKTERPSATLHLLSSRSDARSPFAQSAIHLRRGGATREGSASRF
jgi:hypothetical protein